VVEELDAREAAATAHAAACEGEVEAVASLPRVAHLGVRVMAARALRSVIGRRAG